jgi:TnpA family transposase
VASMLMGFLWHNTDMTMKECYADTHGQSLIGFAFCRLLSADLLPRIKGIDKELLYYPSPASKNKYNNLTDILAKPIDWSLMEAHYEEIVHYAAALRTGAVEPEVIIRQFGKDNNSPVCKALMELGKVIKTIFLCRYLSSESLRIEINEALNVVERVNGTMDFIFYGKLSELSSHQRDEQELSVVCLHLLQVSMVYINTLMIQQILSEPAWKDRLTEEDKRALSPLIHTHINQFGLFILNLAERMAIESTSSLQDEHHGHSHTNTRQKKSRRISEAA